MARKFSYRRQKKPLYDISNELSEKWSSKVLNYLTKSPYCDLEVGDKIFIFTLKENG